MICLFSLDISNKFQSTESLLITCKAKVKHRHLLNAIRHNFAIFWAKNKNIWIFSRAEIYNNYYYKKNKKKIPIKSKATTIERK